MIDVLLPRTDMLLLWLIELTSSVGDGVRKVGPSSNSPKRN